MKGNEQGGGSGGLPTHMPLSPRDVQKTQFLPSHSSCQAPFHTDFPAWARITELLPRMSLTLKIVDCTKGNPTPSGFVNGSLPVVVYSSFPSRYLLQQVATGRRVPKVLSAAAVHSGLLARNLHETPSENGPESVWQGETSVSTAGVFLQYVEDRNRRFNAARRAQIHLQPVFHEGSGLAVCKKRD